MKKTKVLLTTVVLTLMCFTAVSAKTSGLFTRLAPRWGAWSDPSAAVKKVDTSRFANFYLNTAPHTFPLYGDLLQGGQRSTDDYYRVKVGEKTRMNYKKKYGAINTWQQGRVCSSDYEPDARNVTFKFNP